MNEYLFQYEHIRAFSRLRDKLQAPPRARAERVYAVKITG